MTAPLVLANVLSFALQVLVLVASGAVLAQLFRIDDPKAALAYWRALLVACLALPFCQPWHAGILPALDSGVQTIAVMNPAIDASQASAAATAWPLGSVVLLVIAAGIATRACWLAIGGYGLWRLRRHAAPLEPLPASIGRALERIGVQAGMFVSDRVSGPITFGWRRPVVLFPPTVATLAPDIQEAIACHELLHVRRRDWLDEVLEEAIRAVLWFHPAVWWLIGRIQLTREQVVDEAAVQLTDSRERYVEALLAVALARSPRFAPVSPFFRRRLLKRRVARILQETTMTTRRLIASLTASAAVLAIAGVLAIRAFPLEAQGQPPVGKGPVQIVKGSDHLLHGDVPEYPRRAIEQKVEGDVVLDVVLDDRGEVSDARVLSGPDELRRAALESVLQWHYSPTALSSVSTQAIIRFRLPAAGDATTEFAGRSYAFIRESGGEKTDSRIKESADSGKRVGFAFTPGQELTYTSAQRTERTMDKIKEELMNPSTPPEQREELKRKFELEGEMLQKIRSADGERSVVTSERPSTARTFEGTPRLAGIRTERVSGETAREIFAQTGVKVGDPISEDVAKRIRAVAAGIDEHVRVEYQSDGKGNVTVVLLTR